MKKLIIISTALMGLISVSSAYAGTHDPVVNAKQHNQHKRIAQGIKSGELTKGETKQIHQEQKAIRAEEKAYKADGKLTSAERRDLRQDERQASRDIYRKKHNDTTRTQ